MGLSLALGVLCLTLVGRASAQSATWAPSPVLIRFIDSATGYAVQPEVSAQPHQVGALARRFASAQVAPSGHAALALESGPHTLTATSPRHWPMSGPVQVRENYPYQIQFLLDPLELPRELQRDDIIARQREGATLIQGFIVDDDSGAPVRGVRVSSAPSGVESSSDERGFFQLYIPAPSEVAQENPPASLIIEKPGYEAQEQQYLELWSRGDWTRNIRLHRGGGRQIVDQRKLRRSMPLDAPAATGAVARPGVPDSTQLISPAEAPPAFKPLTPGDAGNATIRVPRNIRVEDNGIIYYVSMNFYAKHVLPHEWLASWNITSLYAGAVAVRSYAINRVNGRSPTSDYDICGDSNCQNFKVSSSATRSDNAVDFTEGYVMINGNGNIVSTEYSSENNSLGKPCGDGFTAPTGGCLYDPICAGHDRFGHGRGMCQYGSQRWAIGANGFPVRDWIWILTHYYPDLPLIKGTVLVIGDNIKSRSSDCNVRACTGGGIENGILCPLITSKAAGQTGVIIGGPLVVTNDGSGFTWYQVRWNDAGSTTGWSCENYLERVLSAPTAPGTLAATPAATNRINLSWTDTNSVEAGYYIERAPANGGPWLQIGSVDANVTSFSDLNLYSGSTWYYRVYSYNAAGSSPYSAVASATTPSVTAPTLAPLHDLAVTPGTLITFTNTSSAPERVVLLTDFEAFMSETANGVVLVRTPNFSTSTSAFLDSAPEMDIAAVIDTYPDFGHGAGEALYVHCSFTNPSNPWLRLTTSGTATFGNPVIDLTRKLRFDIFTDRPVKVAVGCRETTTPAGTAIGSDGGTSGASIEWAGVTNVSGTAPMPTRTVSSNIWTTLTFDFPNEPIRSFSGGNGVLSTTSGLGVLEHLAVVPVGGTGEYSLYFDNFAVLTPRTFTYSLGAGAPTNATLNPTTGVFTWTPTQAQSPSTTPISIIVTDNSSPPLRATNTFTVTINNSVPNSAPLLMPISDRTVYVGSTLTFTNSAYDPNPGDTLAFSLDPGAPPSAILNSNTGVFSWTPGNPDTNSVHPITVRVTDSGSPQMSSTTSFSVTVVPVPPPNQAPLLAPVSNRSVNAGVTLTFTNQSFDPDGNALTYSLDSSAPPGATVQSVTGVFTWTPADSDSNTTKYITVRVTDDGVPPLSSSATFSVTVLPRLLNHPPTLSPIAGRTVHAGSTIIFTNTATDPDAADTLSFSLDDNAPSGAEIDIVSGVFTWTTTDVKSDTTNSITVSVTDDGEPSLSASNSFAIIVRPKPVLKMITTSGTSATMIWSAISGVTYRLQYKTNLLDQLWQALSPDITATNEQATATDTAFGLAPQRFYRVRVVDSSP